jgi:hypothetical protein
MRRSTHHSGIRSVYLVAAELSRLGFGVAPTARNAAGADLLIFAAESRTSSVNRREDEFQWH